MGGATVLRSSGLRGFGEMEVDSPLKTNLDATNSGMDFRDFWARKGQSELLALDLAQKSPLDPTKVML